MKKARIQIIFCRFCKLRRRLHISNITSQWDHLSCLIRHMSQRKDNQFEHVWIDEETCFRSNQIFREKISRRVNSEKSFDHYYSYVDIKNHFKDVISFVWHRDVKHQIRLLDLVNTKRVEKTFRTALSSRFSQLAKSANDELHEKRHRFQSDLETSLVQEDHEEL
jgi:hypothetical protein